VPVRDGAGSGGAAEVAALLARGGGVEAQAARALLPLAQACRRERVLDVDGEAREHDHRGLGHFRRDGHRRRRRLGREVGLLINNPTVTRSPQQVFDADWNASATKVERTEEKKGEKKQEAAVA
jgi:hypothetical protein